MKQLFHITFHNQVQPTPKTAWITFSTLWNYPIPVERILSDWDLPLQTSTPDLEQLKSLLQEFVINVLLWQTPIGWNDKEFLWKRNISGKIAWKKRTSWKLDTILCTETCIVAFFRNCDSKRYCIASLVTSLKTSMHSKLSYYHLCVLHIIATTFYYVFHSCAFWISVPFLPWWNERPYWNTLWDIRYSLRS